MTTHTRTDGATAVVDELALSLTEMLTDIRAVGASLEELCLTLDDMSTAIADGCTRAERYTDAMAEHVAHIAVAH
jgi:hypothetical protein